MMHNDFLKRLREIEALNVTVEDKTTRLLRESGWRYSSDYPDCYWRWSKTIGGKVITTTDAEEALRLEERMSPCDEDCRHDD